mmetsp:Transcript_95497/g.212409  ORF Transcript_95497/g.212409 Transcript_95497/m.212409 type:complete len:359 (-) Transcript_95497:11-1087(-)
MKARRPLQERGHSDAADRSGQALLLDHASSGNAGISATLPREPENTNRVSQSTPVKTGLMAAERVSRVLNIIEGNAIDTTAREVPLDDITLLSSSARKLALKGRSDKEEPGSFPGKPTDERLHNAHREQHADAPTKGVEPTGIEKDFASESVEMQDEPPLLLAIQTGDLSEIMRLLQERADPNASDMLGETPLFEAAALGNAGIVAALLHHSADPGKTAVSGMTPSDLAPNATIMKMLGSVAAGGSSESILAELSEPEQKIIRKEFDEAQQRASAEDSFRAFQESRRQSRKGRTEHAVAKSTGTAAGALTKIAQKKDGNAQPTGRCADCGKFCKESGDDGKFYCDACWEAWVSVARQT